MYRYWEKFQLIKILINGEKSDFNEIWINNNCLSYWNETALMQKNWRFLFIDQKYFWNYKNKN